MRTFDILAPDMRLSQSITQKIDNLNKPKGSLGKLENLARRLCLIQQTLSPGLSHPCHLLFGADHGIEREGVSVSPREITWQQMLNFMRGGGGVNMFCRQHGFMLRLIDVGVDYDLSAYPRILNRKISRGTRNFRYEAAMSADEFDRAIDVGCEMVDYCHKDGSNVVCIGEMGIGNPSPSSIWMSLFGHLPLEVCVGAGAGLDAMGVSHKLAVLSESVAHFLKTVPEPSEVDIIRWFGGFEMVSAIGAMLRAAELGLTVLVDGFIMSACMLAASRLYPQVLDYAVFGHCGDESGHGKLLDLMQVDALLHLGLRLGEGTGALCAYPLLVSAVNMMNEMNNFDDAHITRYF